MTFNVRSLARTVQVPIGAVDGFPSLNKASCFFYATADQPNVVEAAGYFNAAREKLLLGSHIDSVMGLQSGTPLKKSYIVTAAPVQGDIQVTDVSGNSLAVLTALIAALPTAPPGAAGVLWADNGKVSVTPSSLSAIMTAFLTGLPVVQPAAAGVLWNDNGVISVTLP